MIGPATWWIAIAEQLAEHAKAGTTRETTALGPFVGLRVGARVVFITSGIDTIVQLRAAIATGSLALDEDFSGDGFTRRRWAESRAWLTRPPV
jgi:hypothetical protein